MRLWVQRQPFKQDPQTFKTEQPTYTESSGPSMRSFVFAIYSLVCDLPTHGKKTHHALRSLRPLGSMWRMRSSSLSKRRQGIRMVLRAVLHQILKVGVFVKPLHPRHGGGSFLCGDPGTGEEWISKLNGATRTVHISVFVIRDWSRSQTTTVSISSAVSACRRSPQLGLLTVNLPSQSRDEAQIFTQVLFLAKFVQLCPTCRYLWEELGVQRLGRMGVGEISPSMLGLALPL